MGIQTASGWPLVASKISMRLAASRTLFLSHLAASRIQIFPGWPPAARKFSPILLLLSPGNANDRDIVYGSSPVACIFACASGHYLAKPPGFCKHAARTIISTRTLFRNLRIYATHGFAPVYPSTLCMSRSNLVRQSL